MIGEDIIGLFASLETLELPDDGIARDADGPVEGDDRLLPHERHADLGMVADGLGDDIAGTGVCLLSILPCDPFPRNRSKNDRGDEGKGD